MDAVEIMDRAIAHVGEHGFTSVSYGGRGHPCCYIGAVNVAANEIPSMKRHGEGPVREALLALDEAAIEMCDDATYDLRHYTECFAGRAAEVFSGVQSRQTTEEVADTEWYGDFRSRVDAAALRVFRRAREILLETAPVPPIQPAEPDLPVEPVPGAPSEPGTPDVPVTPVEPPDAPVVPVEPVPAGVLVFA